MSVSAVNVLLHQPATYADLIDTALRSHPDRVAFRGPHGQLTYGQAHELYCRMRGVLLDRGLGPGEGVALLSRNRPEAFLAVAAAVAIGCRYTALHPLGSPGDHLFVIEDSQAVALIGDGSGFPGRTAELAAQAPGVRCALSLGPDAGVEDLLALAAGRDPVHDDSPARSSDLAFLAYTGGTTGQPKGVMLPHRSLVEMVRLKLSAFDFPSELRFLGCAPISHATGMFIVPTLLRGGSVVLEDGFDPRAFLAAVEAQRITMTFLVPSMIYKLLAEPALAGTDLSSLETIVYGASPISPARLQQAIDRLGPIFQQLYGQSEAPQALAVLHRDEHDRERLTSCGRPVAGVDVRLLDAGGAEVQAGDVGEICARGPLIMDGYWRRPELTELTLRGGWLHTGDLARADRDGYLHIVDRDRDMVISGGFNVYPREIEDVLSAAPEVVACAVIGVPDDTWGEAVMALVVPAAGCAPDPTALKALVRDAKGPIYVPKRLEFVDELPLTPVGKLDKKALRARYWATAERAVN